MAKTVSLVSPGDGRPTANAPVKPMHEKGIKNLTACIKKLGWKVQLPSRDFVDSLDDGRGEIDHFLAFFGDGETSGGDISTAIQQGRDQFVPEDRDEHHFDTQFLALQFLVELLLEFHQQFVGRPMEAAFVQEKMVLL